MLVCFYLLDFWIEFESYHNLVTIIEYNWDNFSIIYESFFIKDQCDFSTCRDPFNLSEHVLITFGLLGSSTIYIFFCIFCCWQKSVSLLENMLPYLIFKPRTLESCILSVSQELSQVEYNCMEAWKLRVKSNQV